MKPTVSCRSCLHSTPQLSGGWYCERHERPVTVGEQEKGCTSHLFVPQLLPFKQVDVTDEGVVYEGAVNRRGGEIVVG